MIAYWFDLSYDNRGICPVGLTLAPVDGGLLEEAGK